MVRVLLKNESLRSDLGLGGSSVRTSQASLHCTTLRV